VREWQRGRERHLQRMAQPYNPLYPGALLPPQQYATTQMNSADSGLFYLWSPLVIFGVVLACVVGLIIVIALITLMYNYCTYGTCCPPHHASSHNWCDWSTCCWCCSPPDLPPPRRRVVRRASVGSVCSSRSGSVRSGSVRRPRVVTFNEPSYVGHATRFSPRGTIGRRAGDESIVVVNRPQHVYNTQLPSRPQFGNIRCFTTADSPPSAFAMQPQMYSHYGGGFGVAPNPGPQAAPLRVLYNSSANPTVACELRQDQSQREYVLTSVDSTGGTFPRGGGVGLSIDEEDPVDIEVSDGRGLPEARSNFYPSLPTYDETDRKY